MKVLSILLQDNLNGVTTFNQTLVNYLVVEKNFDCHVLFLDNPFKEETEYDIIILNNRSGLKYCKDNNIKSKRYLFFVHSLMNKESLPPKDVDKNIEVFTFSEVGEEFLLKQGYESILVRHPIDMHRFQGNPNVTSSRILQLLDLRNGELYASFWQKAARFLGFTTRYLTEPTLKIEHLINESDVCVGYGRHAIEAMAMGKPTIIYGINGGDGLVTPLNFKKLAETNFSGWSLRAMPLPGQITEFDILFELQKIKDNDVIEVTRLIREEYCIHKFIHKLKL